MKKLEIILIFFAVAALSACTTSEDQASIRKQINDYKAEVRELNQKIEALEQKLDPAGSSSTFF